MRRRVMRLLFAALLTPIHTRSEEPAPRPIPDIQLERIADGFQAPLLVTGAHDGSLRLFVVEQAGLIRVVDMSGAGKHTVFLDLLDRVNSGGEKGLLGLAFHPDFKTNGRLFVNYTTGKRGALWTHVSEFTANDKRTAADPASERILLKFEQPHSNHNGGGILFGPDGYLYIGTGDGGSANDPYDNGQRMDTLLGKMLRIDVDSSSADQAYGIPPDNPFMDTPGARPEIYAYGLRNPWRFCFDRVTGWLYAGDVGQWHREEISVVEKGKNYGWRIMEGFICTPKVNPNCDTNGLALPILDYPRRDGISVTGGHVYRGTTFPSLRGVYIYGDYGSGRIWGLRYDGRSVTAQRLLLKSGLAISSFGEDEAGELYVVDHRGVVYRIAAAP